ncbi:hypothetical protein O7626_36765 [Micromonospora sp. WMMD1102]|uniref:hypothetical protein n=1 Tax=Micromonospora sp. WMMD1102 TaxID=3016105 RepID=UPI0024158B04|nr:hypothetical protein [Micromonospora sp. WMMD1102]MDG4791387.1 hypothetical protein [Micromonospora sp. WMMD1102]
MASFAPTEIPVVGPRELPADGRVRVWTDSGSGHGHEITVCAEHLMLSVLDSGTGETAIYDLRIFYCRG